VQWVEDILQVDEPGSLGWRGHLRKARREGKNAGDGEGCFPPPAVCRVGFSLGEEASPFERDGGFVTLLLVCRVGFRYVEGYVLRSGLVSGQYPVMGGRVFDFGITCATFCLANGREELKPTCVHECV